MGCLIQKEEEQLEDSIIKDARNLFRLKEKY